MGQELRNEYSGADLGDERLSRRLVTMGEALSLTPGASFPQIFGDSAGLEGAYRFMSNTSVNPESILAPHQSETVKRSEEYATVVVAHDTTEFLFPGEARQGLGRMRGTTGQGFFAHASLAITSDTWREPLGVLNLETWIRSKTPKETNKMTPRQRQQMKDRESQRWFRCVEDVENQLATGHAIHVMDREADMYDLFAAMIQNTYRFVIRSNFDRRVEEEQKLSETCAMEPSQMQREVPLTQRIGSKMPKRKQAHPPRNARMATLQIKAFAVDLCKPRALKGLPASLRLHVVVAEEASAPEGEPPVCWRLYTTEPIDTHADIEHIIDTYRARWRIEEFFKALKTGCAIKKRQLESAHALLNALAIFIPIAWRVLRLRTLAHNDASRSARSIMSPLQIKILRKLTKKKLLRDLTITDAFVAIAGLGGHLKRNGPPGWITLSRGYERLLNLEEGAILAMEM